MRLAGIVLRGARVGSRRFRGGERIAGGLRLVARVICCLSGFFKGAVVIGRRGGFVLFGFDIGMPLLKALATDFELGKLAG